MNIEFFKGLWNNQPNTVLGAVAIVLILEKMKAKVIEVGSGVLNKKYDSAEVYELSLIHI